VIAGDLARPHRHQRELIDPQLGGQRGQRRPLVALEVELDAALGADRPQVADVALAGVALVGAPVQRQPVGAGVEAGVGGDPRRGVVGAARVAQQRHLVEVDRQAEGHGVAIMPRAGARGTHRPDASAARGRAGAIGRRTDRGGRNGNGPAGGEAGEPAGCPCASWTRGPTA
jgi:hypothetical protein